jgi:hypothetical protein
MVFSFQQWDIMSHCFYLLIKKTLISGGEQFHHKINHLIKCAAFGGAAIGSVVNHAIPAKWGIAENNSSNNGT